jgi:hypothetical protein
MSYNVRDENLSVIDVAISRSIAVTIGVIWAVIVSRVWWPAEARRELGVALSDFLLNIGWLYNRLVLTYSIQPHAPERMSSMRKITERLLDARETQTPNWNQVNKRGSFDLPLSRT